jgi:pimeloyl-ACP methyl ester carboxylesterase
MVRAAKWIWPALLAIPLLSACAQPHRPPPDEKPKFAHGHGYTTERRYATTPLHETWERRDNVIDVELLTPTSPGRYPLIVYLPGLGEAANAGNQWRTAWAEAGYVVLSMQPKQFGPAVLGSSQARSGDFRALAREQFAAAALEQRLRALADVIAEVTVRNRSPTGPYTSIDIDRIAVAGFDLGAQTGMAVAGELTGAATAPGVPVRAMIALSPYVNLAAGGLEQRFLAIATPVLSVTGTDDGDAYGVVSSPALRRAPWQNMPAGDKYLLLLEGATHLTLAGNLGGHTGGKSSTGADSQSSRPDGGVEQRNFGVDLRQNLGEGDPSGSSRHRDRSGGKRGGDKREGDTGQSSNPMHVAYVQGVSTAFLDAVVKKDPIAREWLYRDATRWLADDAEFRIK